MEGLDVSCTNCLQQCSTKYLDSIANPYSYAVNSTPDYQANMSCVQSCYETKCAGATTWAPQIWQYGSREGYDDTTTSNETCSGKTVTVILLLLLIALLSVVLARINN